MSRKFSKVERYFWLDPDTRALARDPRDLFLHLLTSPRQIPCPGLIPASLALVAEDIQWTLKAVKAAYAVLAKMGWVQYDDAARLILVAHALSHNQPENDNVVRGWRAAIDEVPDSPLKDQWIRTLFDTVKELSPNRFETVAKLFTKPYRNPEPDPEPEPEPKPEPAPSREADFDRFWSAYPRKIGKKAARKAWAAAKDKPPIDVILAAVEAAKGSEQWRKDNGQYIPHPSTWINRGGWDDETQRKGAGVLAYLESLEADNG